MLRSAGLDPLVEVSDVDEQAVQDALGDAPPAEIVTALAKAKAASVAGRLGSRYQDAVLLGCDSMLFVGGELVGKPGTVEVARKRWAQMAGNAGELFTGHAIARIRDGAVAEVAARAASTTVWFAAPTEAEIEAYLASGEPLSVAGAFTLDGLGGWFIDRIDGHPSNVIGISLPLVRALLTQVGIAVTDLWTPGA